MTIFTTTELFTGHDEEREETLADYMLKMLTSREISSVNSVPGEPVKESPKTVKPGDWILIKVIKKETDPAKVGRSIAGTAYSTHSS